MQKQQTCSNQKLEPFTIDDLKKCAELVQEQEESKLPKGLCWFTKLMNKFGWYKQCKFIVGDKQVLQLYKYPLIHWVSNNSEMK